MNFKQISILIGGILSLLMVLFHTRFYHLFQWNIDFEKVSKSNSRILYTIHLALILLFTCYALISFIYLTELSQGKGLAFGVLLFYSLFWFWRTLWQVFYFKPSKSRKWKKFRIMHYVLILWFTLLLLAYGLPVIIKIFEVLK
jgi:hypothetical protein